MSLVIDDVIQHLHNNSIASSGSTLFRSYVPESPNAVVSVIDTGGLVPSIDLPVREPTFQVFIRSVNYSNGKTLLDSVRSLLHQKRNTQLVPSGNYFFFIYAQSEGGHLGRDDQGRDLFSINFHCRIR